MPEGLITTEAQRQVERLQHHRIVELEAVREFHQWLDTKRLCRQACRVIGDSRTGKTVTCDAYQHKHTQQPSRGDAPIVSQALEETTAIWEEYVLKLPEPSNLTSAPMQKILTTATRGYLGLLDEILRNAARRTLLLQRSHIDLTLLTQATAEYQ